MQCREYCYLIAILSAGIPSVAESQTQDLRDQSRQLSAYVSRTMADWKIPGLAIAVVKDGRVVYAQGYGVREVGRPERVDTTTLFAALSTTKAMTAAAVGMLVDEGKLRWDDKVTKYLPTFALSDSNDTKEVTSRDLLAQRTGRASSDRLSFFSENSPAEVIRRARFIKLSAPFRSSFVYSNEMYAAAGQIVAAVSGMSWEAFVQTRLFGPLHMTRTVPILDSLAQVSNVTSPHFPQGDTVRVIETDDFFHSIAPAGAVWSTAADMSKWLLFMLDSGRVDGKQLLRRQTVGELLRPQMIVRTTFNPMDALTNPHWTTYGFGWFQEDYAGRMVEYHLGNTDGRRALVGLIPDAKLGVVILQNTEEEESRYALMFEAFDIFLGNPSRDWNAELLSRAKAERAKKDSLIKRFQARIVPNTKPSAPIEAYAGRYVSDLGGEVIVTAQNGHLRIQTNAKNVVATLEHVQNDSFRARWERWWYPDDTVRFTVSSAGATPQTLDIWGLSYTRASPRSP